MQGKFRLATLDGKSLRRRRTAQALAAAAGPSRQPVEGSAGSDAGDASPDGAGDRPAKRRKARPKPPPGEGATWCEKCKKRFNRPWDLTRHLRSQAHGGDARICFFCGKQLSRADAVLRHQRMDAECMKMQDSHVTHGEAGTAEPAPAGAPPVGGVMEDERGEREGDAGADVEEEMEVEQDVPVQVKVESDQEDELDNQDSDMEEIDELADDDYMNDGGNNG